MNGTFVSELDLSQIPGPGTVAAVVGFFNETYIPGGQTALRGLLRVELRLGRCPGERNSGRGRANAGADRGDPAGGNADNGRRNSHRSADRCYSAGRNPDDGRRTSNRSADRRIPPVQSPTPVAGFPTETPVAGHDLPGVDAATNTYTSPTFGYQLTWDPTWSAVTSSSQESFDVLRITNGVTTTDLYSGVSTMSLEQCITSLVEYYQGNASYTNVVHVPFANGQQILIQGNVAIATLTFDYTDGRATTPND